MHDIFISYSSTDRERARAFGDALSAAGYSVWMDTSGIDAATSWSKEIARALEDASVVCVLLSEHSVASHNVAKEIGVAAELGKHLLPVELSPAKLRGEFLYHLANLQRVAIADFEGIVRALAKLGVAQAGSTVPRVGSADFQPAQDHRKSLMILPFEDLSPTQDNSWFADGIVSELVSALGNVKALRLIDWNTSKEFKTRKVPTATLAKELEVRYFLEGQVRKAGENIKVSVSLLDFETGDHLWQDAMKGTMQDVFEMQEKVAEKVVEGLKVHLAADEKKRLTERGTEHSEAYELFLKANEYFHRQTKEGLQLAVQLLTEAIKLDTGYARAYQFKANALANLYRVYDRTPALPDTRPLR